MDAYNLLLANFPLSIFLTPKLLQLNFVKNV